VRSRDQIGPATIGDPKGKPALGKAAGSGLRETAIDELSLG
jgi:hypothetical protein